MTDKRTTVLLDSEDQQVLRELTELLRTTDMEAIRRSIRVTHNLLTWQRAGGHIVMGRDDGYKALLVIV